ncbi:CHAD domain-containing protein [Pseudooceanicola sp. LIPI14-2-Ac024]|uniref:CYTH and CHAD domain-containing protein n=1 Tax=Pseudooceanicola sp. LIPI14-2-Ac024 TaxID=3344875 RepID=UPI0035CF606C
MPKTALPPAPVLLTGDAVEGLEGTTLDTGTLSAAGPSETIAFTLIDTFDHAVTGAGALALVLGDELVLIRPGAPMQRQPAAAPDYVEAMPEGPVTAALATCVPPVRRLVAVQSGEATRQELDLKLVDGAVAARIRTTLLISADGGIATLVEATDHAARKPLKALLRMIAARGTPAAGDLRALLTAPEKLYTSKPAIAMTGDETAYRAATDICRAHLAVATRNEPGVIADLDIEYLHDHRVALRRVRSVLSLFKGVYAPTQTEKLKARFSALMAQTGRLRDLDVQLQDRACTRALVPAEMRPGLDLLFDRFAAERAAAQTALAARLSSEAHAAEIADLEAILASARRLRKGPDANRDAHDYAQKLVWARYRKVCKIAAGIDDTTPDAQVHRLRIQCKKLRYLLEFFAPLFDPAALKKPVKQLKRLQDRLGRFNDHSVQQQALREVAAALDPESDGAIEIATAIGALVTVLNQRQAAERAQIVESFSDFVSDRTRRDLREVFKPAATAKGGA